MSTSVAPSKPAAPGRAGIPRRFATMIGWLAIASAIGVGHLVAGVVSPASSPYLAVGDTVVRLSPEWLVEFAKSTFGTADKPVLLAGMAVVLLLVGAATGIGAHRRPEPGIWVISVLGVLGFLAVAAAPGFAPLDVLAPVASLAAGLTVFRKLHTLALTAGDEPAPTKGAAVSRRRLLINSSVAVGAGALAAGGVGQLAGGGGVGGSRQEVTDRLRRVTLAERAPAIPAGASYPELGTTAFVTPNADFYRIDTALRIPNQAASEWSVRVHGMVDRELTLTFDDLLARPLLERTVTLLCVSNEVGDGLISTANFVGVDLREILLEAGIAPGADQVLSRSLDQWTAGTPVDVLLEPDRGSLLAIGMNGEALPPEHGFPVRMVVPGLYGFVSATKWLAELEVTTFDRRQAYWLRRGWAEKAPIKTQSRIDLPRPYSSVPAGRVVVAGVAWSQPTGISRVEVRTENSPWQDAELATEVNHDTWRMWRSAFDLAPGDHAIQVRATDRNGVTQTEELADVVPDGATGWHFVRFRVS